MEKIAVTTSSGFSTEIDEAVLDDWELLELFGDVDEGSPQKIVKVLPLMFDAEGQAALKEHCRVNGRVSAKKMVQEMLEILSELKAGKNS